MYVNTRLFIMQVLMSHPENVCLISGYKLYKTIKKFQPGVFSCYILNFVSFMRIKNSKGILLSYPLHFMIFR